MSDTTALGDLYRICDVWANAIKIIDGEHPTHNGAKGAILWFDKGHNIKGFLTNISSDSLSIIHKYNGDISAQIIKEGKKLQPVEVTPENINLIRNNLLSGEEDVTQLTIYIPDELLEEMKQINPDYRFENKNAKTIIEDGSIADRVNFDGSAPIDSFSKLPDKWKYILNQVNKMEGGFTIKNGEKTFGNIHNLVKYVAAFEKKTLKKLGEDWQIERLSNKLPPNSNTKFTFEDAVKLRENLLDILKDEKYSDLNPMTEDDITALIAPEVVVKVRQQFVENGSSHSELSSETDGTDWLLGGCSDAAVRSV